MPGRSVGEEPGEDGGTEVVGRGPGQAEGAGDVVGVDGQFGNPHGGKTGGVVVAPGVPGACFGSRVADGGGEEEAAICTGAFALAERYPKVQVDDSVLYVDDGDVLTSAGLTAGLDLCLHLVRRDLGAHVANQLARRMVVPAHRPGGQAQFIDLSVPTTDDGSLRPVLDWARRHLDQPLTVEDLAQRAAMSPRTLHRRLQAATGTTPLQWLLNQRLGRAQHLLESTDLPIEKVGQLSGLGTANTLRHHFLKQIGVSPSN